MSERDEIDKLIDRIAGSHKAYPVMFFRKKLDELYREKYLKMIPEKITFEVVNPNADLDVVQEDRALYGFNTCIDELKKRIEGER